MKEDSSEYGGENNARPSRLSHKMHGGPEREIKQGAEEDTRDREEGRWRWAGYSYILIKNLKTTV